MKTNIRLRKILLSPLAVLGVLLMLAEEQLWTALVALGQRLGRLLVIRSFERRIRELPPNWAALALLAPVAFVLPIKILAVWIMSTGRWGLGIGVLLSAKIAGTAVIARIYTLCEPALSTLTWFVHLRTWFLGAKDWAHKRLNSLVLWRRSRLLIRRLIRSLRVWSSPG